MKNVSLSLIVFAILQSACAPGGKEEVHYEPAIPRDGGSSNAEPGKGQYDEDYIGDKDKDLEPGEKPQNGGTPVDPVDKPVTPVPDPVAPDPSTPTGGVSLMSFKATAVDGTAAIKGKPVRLSVTLYNDDAADATITVTPFIERAGLTDFSKIELPPVTGTLAKKETKSFDITVPVFFSPVNSTAQFALASGPYKVDLKIKAGDKVKDVVDDPKTSFRINPSRTVLVAYGYREAFVNTFDWKGKTPDQYLNHLLTANCSQKMADGSLVKKPRCIQDIGNFSYLVKPVPGVVQPANKNGDAMLRLFETKLGFTKSGLDDRIHGHGFDRFVIHDNVMTGYLVWLGNGVIFENAPNDEWHAIYTNSILITGMIKSWERCNGFAGSEGTIGCNPGNSAVFASSLADTITKSVDALLKD